MAIRIGIEANVNLLALSHAWMHEPSFEKYKKRGHFSFYLLEAMSRDPLPGFTYRGRKHRLQKPRVWYGDFAKDVRSYYKAHKGEIRSGLRYGRAMEAKRFPLQLRQLIETFGEDYKIPVKKVVLSPNVFGVPGEGYGPLLGETAYAVFTPNPQRDQTWLMVHEVCHSLLLPVFASKNVKKLIAKSETCFDSWTTKRFRKYYPKWEWAIEECLIHAIEHYVTGSSLSQKRSWGMNRIDWFVKSWQTFQGRLKAEPELTVKDWIEDVLRQLVEKCKAK
ncbi:hypothetical protein EDM68_01000 [Candidatus Uhrbacteria bacterium]|nr:MAG: hypothetical protein EDM68_01000 [Candidatus Uhrbacteria bacterium]